jgi:hypothetical protein
LFAITSMRNRSAVIPEPLISDAPNMSLKAIERLAVYVGMFW